MGLDTVTTRTVPGFWIRVAAVLRRHVIVYTRHFWTNSFPTVLEPLIFILAVGWGLAALVGDMGGVPYLDFLAPGQVMMAAVFTSAFEESYGAYFRLSVDRNYDAMLVTPMGIREIFWGELLYTGLKGMFYSAVILAVLSAFGTIHSTAAFLVPLIGFFTALAFGSLGLYAVRTVTSINQFNFFISGIVSPLIMFSGTMFPIESLPDGVEAVARWLPLYPMVALSRMCTTGIFDPQWLFHLIYMLTVPVLMGELAVRLMRPKLIR
jgi:lipooligosaccharide transport system permease protein